MYQAVGCFSSYVTLELLDEQAPALDGEDGPCASAYLVFTDEL